MILFAGILAFLVLPIAGVWLIVLGLAGRRDLTRPRCGNCRAELGFEHFEADASCGACGTRVSERAPSCERRRPWWWPLLGGLGAIGLSVGITIGSVVLVSRNLAMSSVPILGPNPSLIKSAIASQYPDGTANEIRSRLARSRMTTAELKSAFLASLGSADAPTPQRTPGALAVAAIVIERDADDPGFRNRVLVECFSPAALWPQILATYNPSLQLDPTTAPHPDHALTRVAVLRSIKVDGVARELGDVLAGQPQRALLLPLPLKPFAPGAHAVLIEVELLLYGRFDATRLRDPDFSPLAESDWPAPLARKTVTLGAGFETTPR